MGVGVCVCVGGGGGLGGGGGGGGANKLKGFLLRFHCYIPLEMKPC